MVDLGTKWNCFPTDYYKNLAMIRQWLCLDKIYTFTLIQKQRDFGVRVKCLDNGIDIAKKCLNRPVFMFSELS